MYKSPRCVHFVPSLTWPITSMSPAMNFFFSVKFRDLNVSDSLASCTIIGAPLAGLLNRSENLGLALRHGRVVLSFFGESMFRIYPGYSRIYQLGHLGLRCPRCPPCLIEQGGARPPGFPFLMLIESCQIRLYCSRSQSILTKNQLLLA